MSSAYRSEQEKIECELMKSENDKDRLRTYDYMRELARMNNVELGHCGHRRGNALAVLDTLMACEGRIEKRTAAFIKKYPD